MNHLIEVRLECGLYIGTDSLDELDDKIKQHKASCFVCQQNDIDEYDDVPPGQFDDWRQYQTWRYEGGLV